MVTDLATVRHRVFVPIKDPCPGQQDSDSIMRMDATRMSGHTQKVED